MGKSSTVAHLALKWAENIDDEVMQHFQLVFFIQLQKITEHDTTLEEIITQQHEDLAGKEEILHSLLQNPDCHTMLILDGLDEYTQGTNTVIDNIVNSNIAAHLSKGLIVITSRPEALNLHLISKQMDKVLVAKGFNVKSIKQCVRNFFGERDVEDGEEQGYLAWIGHSPCLFNEAAADFVNKHSSLVESGILCIPIIVYMVYLLHKEDNEVQHYYSRPNRYEATRIRIRIRIQEIGDIVDLIIDRKKGRKLTEMEKEELKTRSGEKAWLAAQRGTTVLYKVCICFVCMSG